MEEYRIIINRYWPFIALLLGVALVVFLIWDKFLLGIFAKASVKIAGLLLIGIGLLFRKFRRKSETVQS